MSTITPPTSNRYQNFLRDIKTQVVQSRLGAARAVNRSLIGLYWSLGQMIVERQEELGWGSAVVDQLSADLRNEFPDMSGFSPRNLWYIKSFYETYSAAPVFLQQLVAEIPWGQNILIFERVKDDAARRYYLEATARLGWNNRPRAATHKLCQSGICHLNMRKFKSISPCVLSSHEIKNLRQK